MVLKDRIIALMEYSNMNIPKFSKSVGFKTPQTVREIIAGNTKSLSDAARLKILARFPEVNEKWLLTGEGEMISNESKNQSGVSVSDKEFYLVPLLPIEAFANPFKEFVNTGVRKSDCQQIMSPVPGADFAITISGDSMEPKFHDGSIIFIKKINDSAFIPWGNTLVLDTENGAFVKEIYPGISDDSIEARSINPKYPPMQIPKDSIFGMYRVLNVTKFFTTM